MNTERLSTSVCDPLEVLVRGEGQPVMVLINGFRMALSSWERTLPQLYDVGRVVAYNRPGVGKSAKATEAQTGEAAVGLLHALLQELQINGPVVLVAHSFGGLIANLFARKFASRVAGVVFVDAAHPDEHEAQKEFRPPWAAHLLNESLKRLEKFFDPFRYSEQECAEETVRQIHQASDFPAVPIAVVSGQKRMPFVPERSFDLHLQFQEQLAELSPHSERFLAEQSGHFPQITEPDVVVRAVRSVL